MSHETYKFDEGKYEIHRFQGHRLEAFRHGEPWPQAEEKLLGDKLFHAALTHISHLRDLLDKAGSFMQGFADDPEQEGVAELLDEILTELHP